MNEQRKVIYKRRLQIIEGEDLHEETLELLESTITALVEASCPTDYPEEWDLPRLITEVTQYYPPSSSKMTWPRRPPPARWRRASSPKRSTSTPSGTRQFPAGRRQPGSSSGTSCCRSSTGWRDHLAEMDLLREGINLRAMGNQDPLVAWQRDGFEMFGKLMDGIDDDYLRYVFHVQVLAEPAPEPDLAQASYIAADDPVQGSGSMSAAFAVGPTAAEMAEVAADGGGNGSGHAGGGPVGVTTGWPMTGRPRSGS